MHFQVSDVEVETENGVLDYEPCEQLSENSEMAVDNDVVEENRNRSENRIAKNGHNRARSFESDEERKSLLTLRRSQSLKRRDGSWDQKWENQNQAEESRQSRPWTKPGRLNNSYWEKRVQAEHSLPPRTPPPKRKLMGIMDGRITHLSRYSLIININR